MSKKVLTILIVLFLVALGVVAKFSYQMGEESAKESSRIKSSIDMNVLRDKLTQVSQLATVNYEYTEMGVFEKGRSIGGLKIPFTTSKYIMTYDGSIKAGIDLAKTKIEAVADTLIFTLPKAEIFSHEIDQNSVKVQSESNSIFTPVKIEDFAKFYATNKSSMEEKAIASGLLEHAQEKSINSLSLITDPLTAQGYVVRIIKPSLSNQQWTMENP